MCREKPSSVEDAPDPVWLSTLRHGRLLITRFVRKVIVRLPQKPVSPAVVCRIWVTTGRSYAMESCRGRKNGQFTENAAATGSNGPLQSCRGRDCVCYFAALGPLRYILPQPRNHRSVHCILPRQNNNRYTTEF